MLDWAHRTDPDLTEPLTSDFHEDIPDETVHADSLSTDATQHETADYSPQTCLSGTVVTTSELERRSGTHGAFLIPFQSMMIAWFALGSLLGGLIIYLIEHGNDALTKSPYSTNSPYMHAAYLAVNGFTATGFAGNVNLSELCMGSQVVLLLCMQLGSATLISLCPVCVRLYRLSRIIPADASLSLHSYNRIPLWLVEFQSLKYLLYIVLAYQLVVYVVMGSLLALLTAESHQNRGAVDTDTDGSVLWFAVFSTISAFNNVGFSTLSDSFEKTTSGLNTVLAIIVLCGNVMFPIFLRWIIVFMSSVCPQESSTKVYLRHLLLNGRLLYTRLFPSQGTWLLLMIQLVLISIQVTEFIYVSNPPTYDVDNISCPAPSSALAQCFGYNELSSEVTVNFYHGFFQVRSGLNLTVPLETKYGQLQLIGLQVRWR